MENDMTNVDTVSIDNNNTLVNAGVVSKTQDAILTALSTGAMPTRFIAHITGINLLTVRPAVTKLLKAGKVVRAGKVTQDGISENLFALAA
jgi:predicted HTH transcriptional regulator